MKGFNIHVWYILIRKIDKQFDCYKILNYIDLHSIIKIDRKLMTITKLKLII